MLTNEAIITTAISSALEKVKWGKFTEYETTISRMLNIKNFHLSHASIQCWYLARVQRLIVTFAPSVQLSQAAIASCQSPAVKRFMEWMTGAIYSLRELQALCIENSILLPPLIAIVYNYLIAPPDWDTIRRECLSLL